MLSNFRKSWEETVFSKDVLLSLGKMQIHEEQLIVTIQIIYEDTDEVVQEWEVVCTNFKDHHLNVDYFGEFITLLDDHPLLWDHNDELVELFFKGKCEDIHQVVGDLFISQWQLSEGKIPLEKFLNKHQKVADLLREGQGLLSKGPKKLIKEHENVLLRHGYKTTLLDCVQRNEKYKIFICGESYIVAEDFRAIQIK
ncbi:MAG: hypothetical protein ABF649_17765 [Bacillus sp. (in: firmicutes)]